MGILIQLSFIGSLLCGQDKNPTYFPLQQGNVWIYRIDGANPAENVYWKIEVLSKEGSDAIVRYQLTWFREICPNDANLKDFGNIIDVELPDINGDTSSFLPYYRFDEDRFIRFDFYRGFPEFCEITRGGCNNYVYVDIMRNITIDTPIGIFNDCIKLDLGNKCSDGGTILEYWCPNIGMVKWIEISQTGNPDEECPIPNLCRVWVLTSFQYTNPVSRGDVNYDNALDISDPITLISYLFLDTPAIACPNAGDFNLDGKLDVSDPISMLGALFLGAVFPGPGEVPCR